MRSARERLNKRLNMDNLKLLDDIARMATGALGSFSEVRHQAKSMVRQRVDQMMTEMDLVSREDFDRIEAIALHARNRQEELEARLQILEAKLGLTPQQKKTTAKPAKTKKPSGAKKKAKK